MNTNSTQKILTMIFSIFIICQAYSQASEAISYQSIIRNANNNLVTNKEIGLKISILQGSFEGDEKYTEIQYPITNDYGLISIQVGSVAPENFSNIEWQNGPFFIKTEIDIDGGTNYTISGTSQLLSVPYSFYANKVNPINITSYLTDNVNVTESGDTLFLGDKYVIIPGISLVNSPLYTGGNSNTANFSSFVDARDNATYKMVQIGEQIWMAENLRYLPAVHALADYSDSEKRYYVYGYNGENIEEAKTQSTYLLYGVLYNWPASMQNDISSTANPSGVQGICPDGWHLPSQAEWIELRNYLGTNGFTFDGSTNSNDDANIATALAAPIGWNTMTSTQGSPGNSSEYPEYKNKSGFTALPAGANVRNATVDKIRTGDNSYWWSATEIATDRAYPYGLKFSDTFLYHKDAFQSTLYEYKKSGYSIRCVKNKNF